MEFKKQYQEILDEEKRLTKELDDVAELSRLHDRLAYQRRELARDMQSPEYAATRELRIAEYRKRRKQDPTCKWLHKDPQRFLQYMNQEDMYLATPIPNRANMCSSRSPDCCCIWCLLNSLYRRECDLRAEHGEDISDVLAAIFLQAKMTRNDFYRKNDAILRRKQHYSI